VLASVGYLAMLPQVSPFGNRKSYCLGERFFGSTKDHIRNGNWYGNDTLWRTILDLNKILFYGRSDGSIVDSGPHAKRYISLIDGIVAGQGNGPESPDPVAARLIIGGTSPVSVDCAAARLMGFDYRRIPSLARSFAIRQLPLARFGYDDISVFSTTMPQYCRHLEEIQKEKCLRFEPHFGWKDHIEF
jgi:Domain of unknown function (DUF362)